MTNIDLFGDLNNKTVLEIGSGRGEMTRALATCMAGGGGRLIITDISDEHFAEIRTNLATLDLTIDFVRTSPPKLAGIRLGSVDLAVCNYTLSAINAVVGQGELALHKIYEVLKPGGVLYVEEELPFYMAASPAQMIWAEKWRLLKATQLLSNNRPTNEYQPDLLETLVSQAGFEDIEVSDEIATFLSAEWWDDFKARFENSLGAIDGDSLKAALNENLQTLEENACTTGIMEVPYVILTARKPWRIE